jgi:hypothetical protein
MYPVCEKFGEFGETPLKAIHGAAYKLPDYSKNSGNSPKISFKIRGIRPFQGVFAEFYACFSAYMAVLAPRKKMLVGEHESLAT